jgi:ribonuclease D
VSPPTYVDRPHLLRELVLALARETEIGLDTEANSMFAYRERLCLVQIATRRRSFLVDPLADLDIGELAPALADPGLLKVLHGAEFDVLLLKRTRPFEIAGLYDTRVAAASLGMASTGLSAVLEELIGVRLDKRYQRSDWGARPLTAGQCDYAARDVLHLPELAEIMRDRVRDAGSPHPEEVAAECRRIEMLEPGPDRPEAEAWSRIRGANALDGRGRRALADLDAWRHLRARERDVPPFKVLGNDALLRLAAEQPRDRAGLADILPVKIVDRIGGALLAILDASAGMAPLARAECGEEDADPTRLDPRVQQRLDRLRRARKEEAIRRRTDPALVLGRATMEALAGLRQPPSDLGGLEATGLLEGWRLRHAGAWILRALRA